MYGEPPYTSKPVSRTGREATQAGSRLAAGEHLQRSLVAWALVPAAQRTPPALLYMARSTTIWAGVSPVDSTIAPKRLSVTAAPKSAATATLVRERGSSA